ncbi:MAG: 3'-5' exonuclease [Methanobacteriota archaeon]
MRKDKKSIKDKTLLFFDTETTGLPSRDRTIRRDPFTWPRLVELGWILSREDGTLIDSQSSIIIPDGFDIPEASSKIHGITTDEAREKGRPVREVISEFCEDATRADMYIAHNLSFDIRIILSELIRSGKRGQLPTLPGICTMRSSVRFCAIPGRFGKGFKWASLSFLHHALFKVNPTGGHRALIDAHTCASCYHELVRRGVIMGEEDITRIVFQEKRI